MQRHASFIGEGPSHRQTELIGVAESMTQQSKAQRQALAKLSATNPSNRVVTVLCQGKASDSYARQVIVQQAPGLLFAW